jgi:hypothetical protein
LFKSWPTVRALGFDLPDPITYRWVHVVRPASIAILPAVSDLGAGEREALALAAETPDTVLIIDGLARRHAEILHVRFTGTAGLLVKANGGRADPGSRADPESPRRAPLQAHARDTFGDFTIRG